MFKDLRKDYNLVRILIILLIIAVGSYVLSVVWQIIGTFSDLIIILIISWLVSFIVEPLVEGIVRVTKLSKFFATLIVYILFCGILALIIFLFIPVVSEQIQALTKIIPGYLAASPKFITNWVDVLTSQLNNAISFIPSVAQFFFSLFIILIFSFYFIVDKARINQELFYLTPKSWHEKIAFIQKVIDDSFASFLRLQLIFGLITGVLTWFILRLFNIDFAASSGLLAGIFAVIPLAGAPLALIPPVFIAYTSDPTKALIIFVILLIAQQFVFNVLGAKLLGRAFRIHPVIVLASFIVGFKIAGGLGAVFAVPVLGIAAVIIRHASHSYFANKR